MLANRVLAKLAAEHDVALIDIWPETSVDGYLRPEFDLDGMHLSREAALISLKKITDRMFDARWGLSNLGRYLWLERERSPKRRAAQPDERWTQHGFAIRALNADSAAALRMREQAPDLRSQAPCDRLDWVAAPLPQIAGMRVASPDEEQTALAKQLLEEASTNRLLQVGSNTELTVTACKGFVLPPDTSTRITPLVKERFPVRKALLSLGGEGTITLNDQSGQCIHELSPEPGVLLVYDPQRLQCQLTTQAQALELLDLALVPRHLEQPFRVVASGLNDWPVDPFQFSTQGMSAVPPIDGDYMLVRAT